MTDHQHQPDNHMTNSHILVHGFDYYEPASLDEAVDLLSRYSSGARLIAGGTQLLTMMKMERGVPQVLISLNKIPGLDAVRRTEQGELEIGACATIHSLRHHPLVKADYPALAQACASFGSAQIEIMATIGGNLCNGSPASDTIPALLVFDASLVIVGPQGARRLPAGEFFQGPGKVNLQPGEILEKIVLPAPPAGSASAFFKISRVSADLAKASLGILLSKDGNRIGICRLAYGSVAPTAMRLPQVEQVLRGQEITDDLLAQAGKLAGESISPIDDVRSTAWYRRQIVDVMTRDAVRLLWDQPEGQAVGNPAGDLSTRSNGNKAGSTNGNRPFHKVKHGERKTIELTVNGVLRRLDVAPHDLLLNVLRDRLQLTGTKYGCGLGECSACTIHLDGEPALSCLVLAISADGKDVVTIEGLQKPTGELDPLQEAFIDEGAFQCGYCTPGILMTVKGLLKETGRPSEAELRDYLKGNRCRCTGYTSIVRAVMASLEKSTAGEPA
jgi:carbon-monoxide dehydrogenase medium subunit